MSRISSCILPAAGALALAAFGATPAYSHAVCGDRIFQATLGIDDPGVGDELALPTLTYLNQNSGGAQESDASFNWVKTILPGLGLSVGDVATWQNGVGYGSGGLNTELKYNFMCFPDHEFMGSVGLVVNWANTGTGILATPYNVYSPVLDIGKGFGDLPTSLNPLRPLGVTFAIGENIPGQSWTNGNPNSTNLNGGFTIQYSLPYYNSHVAAIDNAFVRHLVPITEFTFSRPIANYAPGGNVTTGTIQPGVIYAADTWQLALEAIVPINGASGHGVGAVGELHFFFDDIFPDSLGKPLFGGVK